MISTFDLITYCGLSTLMDFEKCFCIRPNLKFLTKKCLLKNLFSNHKSEGFLIMGDFHPCFMTIKVLAIHRKHPQCTQRNWRELEEQRLFVTTKLDSRWQQEFLFSVKIVLSRPFVTLFVSWWSLVSDWTVFSNIRFSLVITRLCNAKQTDILSD